MNNKFKSCLNKIKSFTLDWIWQLPQNLLGYGYKVITNAQVLTESNLPCKLYNNIYSGSVSLGKYIFLSKWAQTDNYTINHEIGHSKQSLFLGPLYLLVIGLPSIIWACLHSYISYFNNKYNYYDFYTEKWANKLMSL